MSVCDHFDHLPAAVARTHGCEECLQIGGTWVHLRMCLACGHVGCCNASEHRHARRHFEATGHPVMRSAQPGEGWGWCYVHQWYAPNVG